MTKAEEIGMIHNRRRYLNGNRLPVIVAAVIAILIIFVLFDFGVRRGRTPRISNQPASIASLEKIKLGGVEQWILLRGEDTLHPVLLFLHGGPGMPVMYLAHAFQREFEKDFVIVHWDRRGAGKSYAAGLQGEITVRQTLDDTFELTRMLLARFQKNKIYLVGHSWGTYLGMLAVREHPEYYAAYVGIGQESTGAGRVHDVQRSFLVQKARDAGDAQVLSVLQSDSAHIREDYLFRYGAELHESGSFWPLFLTGLQASEYSFTDMINVGRGAQLMNRKMVYNVITGALADNVRELDIPIFFFLGKYDYSTPSTLAAEYLDSIACPLKGLVWFDHSAHFPFYEEPDRFHVEMVRVDSLAKTFWSTTVGQGKTD